MCARKASEQVDASPAETLRTLADLVPDPANANKGTERGAGMIEHSLQRYGAGRSVLVDKHGVVIAGNKTVEGAAAVGLSDVVVVKTDGRQLVVVQRMDLDMADEHDGRARLLAIADNRVAEVGLAWDRTVLGALVANAADLSGMFSDAELAGMIYGPSATDETEAETGAGAGSGADKATCPACGCSFEVGK